MKFNKNMINNGKHRLKIICYKIERIALFLFVNVFYLEYYNFYPKHPNLTFLCQISIFERQIFYYYNRIHYLLKIKQNIPKMVNSLPKLSIP